VTHSKYVLVNPTKKALVRTVDAVGGLVYGKLIRRLTSGVSTPPKQINSIGCLLLDHIGDVLMATPALAYLRKTYPDAKITAIVGPWARGVLEGNPDVDEIIEFTAPWFERDPEGILRTSGRQAGILGLRELFRTNWFDMVIDFRGDLRHIIAMARSPVPFTVGYGITGGGFMLSMEVPYPYGHHAVVKHLGLPVAVAVAAEPSSESGPRPVPNADTYLGGAGASAIRPGELPMPADHPLVMPISSDSRGSIRSRIKLMSLLGLVAVVHPGAGRPDKIWQIEKWHALIKRLMLNGYSVLVSGSKAETELVEAVSGPFTATSEGSGAPWSTPEVDAGMDVPRRVVAMAGMTSLNELAALIDECDLYIGGDTGPTHIAASTSTPVVALYGENSDPIAWGPWGSNERVVTPHAVVSREDHFRDDVTPNGIDASQGHAMEAITVNSVIAAARELMGGLVVPLD